MVPEGARPTSGRVREALFSRWRQASGGERFLDLFAGSGIVGIEALSRGGLRAVFVEADRRSLRWLTRNCRKTLTDGSFRVVRGSALSPRDWLDGEDRFDHVFADPPYGFRRFEELLETVATALAPSGEAAIEHSSRVRLPKEACGLARVENRRYGESELSFYRFKAGGS